MLPTTPAFVPPVIPLAPPAINVIIPTGGALGAAAAGAAAGGKIGAALGPKGLIVGAGVGALVALLAFPLPTAPGTLPGLDPGLNDPEPSPGRPPKVLPRTYQYGPDPLNPSTQFKWRIEYGQQQIQHTRKHCYDGEVTKQIDITDRTENYTITAEAVRWSIVDSVVTSAGCDARPQGFDLLEPKPETMVLEYLYNGEWYKSSSKLREANVGTLNGVYRHGRYFDTWVNIYEVKKEDVVQPLPEPKPLWLPKQRPTPVPVEPLPQEPEPVPLPGPAPLPEPSPKPQPLRVPSPGDPKAPPVVIPKVPPAEPQPTEKPKPTPLPQKPTPYPLPVPVPDVPSVPEPSPDPNPQPAPGPRPLPDPVPVPQPEREPNPKPTRTVPVPKPAEAPVFPNVAPRPDTVRPTLPSGSPAPAPVAAPLPTPRDYHFPVTNGPPVTSAGARTSLAGISQEVARIEQKTAAVMNGGPGPNFNWTDWLDTVGDAVELIANLNDLLAKPSPAMQYTLTGVCEELNDDGEQPVFSAPIGEQPAFDSLMRRVDALSELLQAHLGYKTPTCNAKPQLRGDWVTAQWISDEASADSPLRLRKRTRYRSESGRSDAELAAYFAEFAWEAGPVCVRHTGAWWGDPQVWASTVDEGKRVLRHLAGEAGIDPDSTGRWAVSGSRNPRFGRTGTMRLRTIAGFPWVSSRDGSNMLPMG